MTETTAACTRGCTMYRHHLAECEFAENFENGNQCRGCLPQRATKGNLCATCARRLELMIIDAPTVIRWLTGNMTDGGYEQDHDPTTEDGWRLQGARAYPAPIKVQMMDLRDLLQDRLTLWVDDWCEHKHLTGPERHTPETDSHYLQMWFHGICHLDWIADWWTEMAETFTEAHTLAPWRPQTRRLPGVPCPGCSETNLVIYGGDTDVSCQSCRITMTEDRFELWQRVLVDERQAAS